MHMPGHKGRKGETERLDITEISGADSLYEANGIIAESEKNAGALFGAHTFYSAEGSSLSIRAMLYLVSLHARSKGKKTVIAAARNVHKSFVSAAALLDIDVRWIESDMPYLSCKLTERDVIKYLDGTDEKPIALYITSPDYLGNTSDIKGIAQVCRQRGVLLCVDNAHGAYLKFLPVSEHPIDLGADICCDSAHKTLSALTGSAYLHISYCAPAIFVRKAKQALSLFGSTSPSYLILCSLDELNLKLDSGYKERLADTVVALNELKEKIKSLGYTVVGNEKMKLTLMTKSYGYTGYEVADYLLEKGIVCEFSDPDYLTLMPSVETKKEELEALYSALADLPQKQSIDGIPPAIKVGKRVMSIREAMLSEDEVLSVNECVGRVAASTMAGCPPAVPIALPGEIIDENAVKAMRYYGFKECAVVKE